MEPVDPIIGEVVVALLVLYVCFWYILPFIWKYILLPLGRLAYFLLLLTFGISFFLIFFVGKQVGIPEDIQIAMAVFSGVVAGLKWAIKQI
jgi:hypothetical protein